MIAAVPVYQLKYRILFYNALRMKTSAYTITECALTPAEEILEDLTSYYYIRVMSETRKYMDS
ncbi:hypothetical protein EGD75_24525 [Escherichia coli]|nr:hypothetical protein [Escherichia coli]RCC29005.1 hypothetical protein C6B01_23075 [Escherichia coli]RCC92049.1 hypothetical protein C6B26_10090 [Escherichia coli]RCE05446.1 hypothetical protein C6B24_10435 [Escherichia coli]RCE12746.1 hypothetical protein C6B43_10430 [Escherichia coli]